MEQKTTRQKIARKLELTVDGFTPIDLANQLEDDITESEVLEHLEHVSQSHNLAVIPPECEKCGFNNYDKYLNIPSGCPECNADAHSIKPPVFKIQE